MYGKIFLISIGILILGCSSQTASTNQAPTQGLTTIAMTSDLTGSSGFSSNNSVQFSYYSNYFLIYLNNYNNCSGSYEYSAPGSIIPYLLPQYVGSSTFWAGTAQSTSPCLPNSVNLKIQFVSQDSVYNYYYFYLPNNVFEVELPK